MANKTKKNGTVADVSAFLTGNANAATPKGKKNGIPEISGIEDLADRTFEANKAMKDAEATFRALEAQVLDTTSAEYVSRAKSGDFSKSYNIPGTVTPGVQVSYKDAFSDLPIESKAAIQEQLGDRFDTYFEEKRVLTLSDTSDGTIQLLLEKLGPETFKQIFAIKVALAAKPDMDRKQFDLPEDARPKQYKPSLKIRT